ncbi:DUF732 domain-containing protein [Mycobacterium sp. E740]|uniref:DUF732 domain-containing protein n=1 Tax=Mycobacterium sp. E740 TaxID=1834149 RepID=UPI0008014F25|nr:DUF732 domain-containing protein [Mycobacterium sp. E740]OBI74239.1 hypothetical protein A5663_05835 [Mycobacterium sp. E740]
MRKTVGGTIVAAAVLSPFAMTAAPAHADEATYLQQLMPRYTQLSPEKLLAEGYRVCRAEHNGTISPTAVDMVYREMGVSLTAAYDIVRAAVVQLDC